MTHLRLVSISENCSLDFWGGIPTRLFSLPENAEVGPDLLIPKRHAERSRKLKGVTDAGNSRNLPESRRVYLRLYTSAN